MQCHLVLSSSAQVSRGMSTRVRETRGHERMTLPLSIIYRPLFCLARGPLCSSLVVQPKLKDTILDPLWLLSPSLSGLSDVLAGLSPPFHGMKNHSRPKTTYYDIIILHMLFYVRLELWETFFWAQLF